MKRFEVVINGMHEEEIGLQIIQGIYAAIASNGYTDVSVSSETIPTVVEEAPPRMVQVPEFLSAYAARRG